MIWDDNESGDSLQSEDSESDIDFWEDIKEIDIGITHMPVQRPGQRIIPVEWRQSKRASITGKEFQRTWGRRGRVISLPPEAYEQDFEAKLEKVRAAAGEKAQNAIAVCEKRMSKETDIQLQRQAEEFRNKIDALDEKVSELHQTVFKRDMEIRILNQNVLEQEAFITQIRASKNSTAQSTAIWAVRKSKRQPTKMVQMFEELDVHKSTIETLKKICDLSSSNQSVQQETIEDLRQELVNLAAHHDEELAKSNQELCQQLRDARDEIQRLRFNLVDLKDTADKEIQIKDELCKRRAQTIEDLRDKLRPVTKVVHNARLTYKLNEKIAKPQEKAAKPQESVPRQRQTPAFRRPKQKRPCVLSRSEHTSPQGSNTYEQKSPQVASRSEKTSPQITPLPQRRTSDFRKSFNGSSIDMIPTLNDCWLTTVNKRKSVDLENKFFPRKLCKTTFNNPINL